MMTARTLLFTIAALIAFAGNSILCRMALGEQSIDAGSFTSIRLLSGVVVLLILLNLGQSKTRHSATGSWAAGCYLFLYAVAFSYAYMSLDTGTGALILFGAVQVTMILRSLFSGQQLLWFEWLGVLAAFSGFVYLVLPDLDTPSLQGFILMTIAGIAWGFYTLAGKGSSNALADTSFNFLRTLPFVLLLTAFTIFYAELSQRGVILAILSGGLASGVGYAIWYKALGGLTAVQAGVVQLLVPVIAAAGGVLFSAETISMRLVIASVIILGGILTVILGKQALKQAP
jgi:drug/metabolite transporter (DMT)-like permease